MPTRNADLEVTPPTPGALLLVPNTLDLGAEAIDLREVIPDPVLHTAAGLRHWVVEDARSARAFLKRVSAVVPLVLPLQALDIRELPRPAKGGARPSPGRSAGGASGRAPGPDEAMERWLEPALRGESIGLLSEAGLPAVADPGAALVAAAHRLGVPVRSLSGPSSLMLALAASGLDGQSFAFVGYLPQDAAARVLRVRELEAASRRLRQTQIAIETPYRNPALMRALVDNLAPSTRLSVSLGLTLPGGWSRTDSVAGWRAQPRELNDRTPAVFLWLA